MQHRSLQSLSILLLLTGQLLYAQQCFSQAAPDISLRSAILPFRIIDGESLRGMGANNLAEALRFELNVEVELAPEIGGARMRTCDLNSRYTKILRNGIPVSGSDMFGGHVDISTIPLQRVERVELSYAPLGTEYGSGTLAMIVNVVTMADLPATLKGTSIYGRVYEEAVNGEYNLKTNAGAQGRHVQQLGIQHYSTNGLFLGVDLQRDAFKGVWANYSGNLKQPDYTNSRGYAWSPATKYNGDAFIGYQHHKIAVLYQYSITDMEVKAFGHINTKEYRDGDFLDFYTTTDNENRYRRQIHNLQFQGQIWRDATLNIALSYQDANTHKRNLWVRTADNVSLHDSPSTKLYGTQTWYSKGTLDKPVFDKKLQWTIGYEAALEKAFTAAEPGTYTSQKIDREILQFSGFSYLNWNPFSTFILQPGIRLAYQRSISYLDPLPALSLGYRSGRHHFGLNAEQVNRFPNQRELFTYLDSEFNLLEGSTALHPEHGIILQADWQYVIPLNSMHLQTRLSSTYRQLKDRIIIVVAPQTDAQQERYHYANQQKHRSWLNSAEIQANTDCWRLQLAYSLLGLRGNDFADSEQYDRYLFHSELGASGRYSFGTTYWLQFNYRYIGGQSVYSFERAYGSTQVNRIHNRAPAYHFADINLGTSFLNQRLGITLGLRNLFDSKSVNFKASDGLDHYTGDLRTIYTGYGRSLTLQLSYQLQKIGK